MSHDRRKPIRYNRGMLRKEKRAIGTVWVFRWSEEVDRRRHQHKEVIGTTKEFPTEAAASKEADRLRCQLNEDKQSLSLKTVTFGELINHYLTHELPRLSKSARKGNKSYIKNWIEPAWHGHIADSMKTMQIQEWLDRIHRPDSPRWNQAEDQEHSFSDFLAWSTLGIRKPQPRMWSGRDARPPRRLDRSPTEQQNLDQTRDSSAECSPSHSRGVAAPRDDDGSPRCGHSSKSIGTGRFEVEERWLEHWHTSIRICICRRRIEGDQEPEQRFAAGSVRSQGASSVARAHTLSLGRRLDLCQSTLPRQDAVHVPNPVPPSHSPGHRASIRTQEQQAGTDRLAHATPVAGHIADLERRECEGCTITTSSHYPKDNLGTLSASGFSRPAESPQQGRPDGCSEATAGETESEKRSRNPVEKRVLGVLGVRGCLESTLLKFTKCFEIMVSAAGFEPATHALKGRSVAPTLYMFQ